LISYFATFVNELFELVFPASVENDSRFFGDKSRRDRSAGTGCCVDDEQLLVLKRHRRGALDSQCKFDGRLLDLRYEERRSEIRRPE